MDALRIIAVVLGFYGALNTVLGIFGHLYGLPLKSQIGIILVGILMLASAVGLWQYRKWAAVLGIACLAGISALTYYNELVTSGPGHVAMIPHLIRGLIGAVLVATVILRWGDLRRRQ